MFKHIVLVSYWCFFSLQLHSPLVPVQVWSILSAMPQLELLDLSQDSALCRAHGPSVPVSLHFNSSSLRALVLSCSAVPLSSVVSALQYLPRWRPHLLFFFVCVGFLTCSGTDEFVQVTVKVCKVLIVLGCSFAVISVLSSFHCLKVLIPEIVMQRWDCEKIPRQKWSVFLHES